MSVSLTIYFQFDSVGWQTAPGLQPPGETILVTWNLTPAPIDGGMPEEVRVPFSEALCSLGTVVFAEDQASLSRAVNAAQLAPAFSSGRHPWSMNAQWLAVVHEPIPLNPQIVRFVRQLYDDWTLPSQWPSGVQIVVQAAVDGDAAACHCRDGVVKDALVGALRKSAGDAGMQLTVLPSQQ